MTLKTFRATAIVAVVGACSPSTGQLVSDKDVPVTDAFVATTNGNLRLRDGWDYLHDLRMPTSCVAATGDDGPQVGERSDTFELVAVESREELARALDLDLSLQGSAFGVGIDGKLGVVERMASSTFGANLLFKVSSTYVVRDTAQRSLSSAGREALSRGMDEFLRVCGTHSVQGIRYGAELYVLVSYRAESEQLAKELKAELGLEPGRAIPGVDLQADLATRMAEQSSRSGVAVDLTVISSGFAVDGSQADVALVSELLGSGVDAGLFETLDGLFAAMQDSVEADLETDAGFSPSGTPRRAVVTAVSPALYTSLPDFTDDPFMPMYEALARIQDNEDYLRSLGELMGRMADVYQEEIEPFREADGPAAAAFNLRAGVDPMDSLSDLVETSDIWEYEFLPASTSSAEVGVSYEKVEKAFKTCWQRTAGDLLEACGPGDVATLIDSDPVWLDAEWALASYDELGRILPVRTWSASAAVKSVEKARDICATEANFGTVANPVRGRLPTREEAFVLAPLLGWGDLDWADAELHHAIWTSGSDAGLCGRGKWEVFTRDPAAPSSGFTCVDGAWPGRVEILPVCVPFEGPVARGHAP